MLLSWRGGTQNLGWKRGGIQLGKNSVRTRGSIRPGVEGERISLGEGALEEDAGSGLETSLGMQTWPKDLVCTSLLLLADPNTGAACTGDQSTLGSHPNVGGAPGAAPCPHRQVPCYCFPSLSLSPEPPEGGEILPSELEAPGRKEWSICQQECGKRRRGGAVISSAGLS